MPRVAGIISAAIVVAQFACVGVWAVPATELPPPASGPSSHRAQYLVRGESAAEPTAAKFGRHVNSIRHNHLRAALNPEPELSPDQARAPDADGNSRAAGQPPAPPAVAKFARRVSFIRHTRPHTASNPEPELSPDEALTPDAGESTQAVAQAPALRPGLRRQLQSMSEDENRAAPRRSIIASRSGSEHRARGHVPIVAANPGPNDEPLSELPPGTLSDQEESVGEIANRNGDRTFLMVDKALGRILLFENGEPVFMGRALTGESYADRMPANEMKEKFDNTKMLEDKVTPAGRFTVTRNYDPDYGPLFDIKEIHGKDWGIAIHKVYLGIPSEHRAARLASPGDDDKNITFGCINVTPEAIKVLLRELPETGPTPLYVLPRNEVETESYFAAGSSFESHPR
jgi:hypothetical protein